MMTGVYWLTEVWFYDDWSYIGLSNLSSWPSGLWGHLLDFIHELIQ